MTMRRLEFLLNSLRRSTDNVQTSAITDAEMVEWYNDGQKLIQNLIFKMNPKADIFQAVEVYDANQEGVYDLPEDIYAVNAISLVEASIGQDMNDNDGFFPISRVDDSDRTYLAGYFIRNSQLIFTGNQATFHPYTQIRVTYFRALPRVDKRWGEIQTVNSGVSLVLQSGYDDLASTVDDYVTVVNSLGAVIRDGIRINSFGGATWTTTDALTGVTAGMYVLMGGYSTNISELPVECEPYLQDYVRKRLFGRNIYDDTKNQDIFTAEQKEELIRLFSNNSKEILSPPITDLTFLDF
jgi:hypothetical protein